MALLIALIVAAAVLVVASTAWLVVVRRRSAEPELEPPAAPRRGRAGTTVAEPPATVEAAPGPAEAEATPEEVVEVPELDEATVAELEEALAPVKAPPKPSFRERLTRARSAVSGYLGAVLSRTTIDAETWEELEEALIRADVGVATTSAILDELRAKVEAERISDPAALVEVLKDDLKSRLAQADRQLTYRDGVTNVWLFVGVNGVGKTTTIGKVGRSQADAGHKVVMAAGDTFRAAAAEQLDTWAERAGADFVRGAEGADPGSVIFDAVERAHSRGADLVLADTAGRLHTKSNLMEELRKVKRVAAKGEGEITEVLLVIDATTGQNGLVQAREFAEAVGTTGVVLTKLDGSAKGGIVLAIQTDLGMPVKLVGLGEGAGDLVEFDPDEFVDALFATT